MEHFLKQYSDELYEKNNDVQSFMRRLSQQVFTFGKHKGETYQQVYETDLRLGIKRYE